MPAIFICYRRDDTLSATGRLTDYLALQFGPEALFRDLDDIEAGADFRAALADALHRACVVLVVIGRSWPRVTGVADVPRLFEKDDHVRREIEAALALELPIIPVLVEGARMPSADDLPESIRALAYRNAHEIAESRWHHDAAMLVELLARETELTPVSFARPTAPLSVGSAIGQALFKLPNDLLHLLYEPRRFLVAQASGALDGLVRGLTFLFASQIAGGALVLTAWPTHSSILSFLVTPSFMALLATIAVSIPLYLAWRVAGAPRHYQRVLVILLYQAALAGLVFEVATLITLTGMALTLPSGIEQLAATPTLQTASAYLVELQAAPHSAPWVLASMVTAIMLFGLMVWLLRTWAAYRLALQQPRSRSAAALALFVVFVATPMWLLAWVGFVLERAGM
jgi:hypothetical protein